MKKVQSLGLIVAAALLAVSMPGQARKPMFDYACEVQTKSGIAGLALIQAFSLRDAERMSTNKSVPTMAGERSPAIALVECIEQGGEQRFRDSAFQKFYEEFPM